MTLLFPGLIEALLVLAAGLLGVWTFSLHLLARLRRQETAARERVTHPALDALGQLLMVKMDEKFDAMEAAQSQREQERMAYLLKNAEELGGVRSTNQLLTGQLATLAAKLDRQIELTRVHPSASAVST